MSAYRRPGKSALVLSWALLGVACSRDAVGPARGAPILVGAGDIADCASSGDEATAALLDHIGGTVFTAGDNAYENGSLAEYLQCYDPGWGRHKRRTRPSLGNHEYNSEGAGYFAYFGEQGGPSRLGYYSYDLGRWHIVVLNSHLEYLSSVARSPDLDLAVQRAWVVRDLRAHPSRCTLAYFHHPRYSSGLHGNQPQMQELWKILHEHGVDVVVAGHDHSYERFAPQDASGVADPTRGIREFVVGTGGKSLRGFATIQPNSELRYNASFAVIKFVLRPFRYRWELVTAPDGEVVDSGEGRCH